MPNAATITVVIDDDADLQAWRDELDRILRDVLLPREPVLSACVTPYHDTTGVPTDLQMLKVGSQWRGRRGPGASTVRLLPGSFDLPPGYIVAEFDGGQTVKGGFTLGVSPEGEGSS